VGVSSEISKVTIPQFENSLLKFCQGKSNKSDYDIRNSFKTKKIVIHTSCFLNKNRMIQRIISSPAFHGKPRYDHIKLNILEKDPENPGQYLPKDCYAKVHLLFTYENQELGYLQYLTKQLGENKYQLIDFYQVFPKLLLFSPYLSASWFLLYFLLDITDFRFH
jgi:hypothetical protein